MMSSNRLYRFLFKEPASREDTVCSPTQPRAVERKLISAEAKHITRRFDGYAASQSVAKAAIVDCSLTKDELISCHLFCLEHNLFAAARKQRSTRERYPVHYTRGGSLSRGC